MSSDESSSDQDDRSPSPVPPPKVVKKTTGKRKKDIYMGPKRPLSAYMFFCKNNREKVMKEDPTYTFCQVGKLLGSRWREMNIDMKQEYVKMSEKDKVRYENEGGAEARKKAQAAAGLMDKNKKSKKNKDGPKRSLSAFMYYAKDKRGEIKAAHPGITFGEIGKEIGKAWKLCTPEEKEPFNKLAAKDKLRYEAEMNQMPKPVHQQKQQVQHVKSESEEESGSDSESSGSGSGSDDGSDSEDNSD